MQVLRQVFNCSVYLHEKERRSWDLFPIYVYITPAFFAARVTYNSMGVIVFEVANRLSGFDLPLPRQYSDGILVYQSM